MHADTLSPGRRDCSEVTLRPSAWQLAFLNHSLTAELAAQTKDGREEAVWRRKGESEVNAASEDQQKNISDKIKMPWQTESFAFSFCPYYNLVRADECLHFLLMLLLVAVMSMHEWNCLCWLITTQGHLRVQVLNKKWRAIIKESQTLQLHPFCDNVKPGH